MTTRYDRTDLALGVLQLAHKDFKKSLSMAAFDDDLEFIKDENDPIYLSFCQKFSLNPTLALASQFRRAGNQCRAAGVARQGCPIEIKIGDKTFSIHRPFQFDDACKSFEAILPRTLDFTHNAKARNRSLTKNHDNSCAFEELVVVCLYLGLGLRQGDMMTCKKIRQMTSLQVAFYTIMRLPIHELKTERVEALVKVLMDVAVEDRVNPYEFGDFVDINDYFSSIMPIFGGCVYSLVEAYTCCDNVNLRIDDTPAHHVVYSTYSISLQALDRTIIYPGLTIGQILQKYWFGSLTKDESNLNGLDNFNPPKIKCTKREHCTQIITKHKIGTSGLPVNAIILLRGGLTLREAVSQRRSPFEDILLTQTLGDFKTLAILMEVVCVVFCVNDNHFISRQKVRPTGTLDKTSYFEHDGLKTDAYVPYESWTAALKEGTTKIVTVIYQRHPNQPKTKTTTGGSKNTSRIETTNGKPKSGQRVSKGTG